MAGRVSFTDLFKQHINHRDISGETWKVLKLTQADKSSHSLNSVFMTCTVTLRCNHYVTPKRRYIPIRTNGFISQNMIIVVVTIEGTLNVTDHPVTNTSF